MTNLTISLIKSVLIFRALIKASTEVVKSEKLKEMLTLLLGFGNYFNFGKRGKQAQANCFISAFWGQP